MALTQTILQKSWDWQVADHERSGWRLGCGFRDAGVGRGGHHHAT